MKIQQHQSIVICGPSGSGKSTLLRRLLSEHKDKFAFTVSHTTRQPRKGELNGREYHFVDRDEMIKMIGQNDFVEYTQFANNYYGTSKRAIRDAIKGGHRNLIIEVDIEGVKALSSIEELNAMFIFVKPPSKLCLLKRLIARGTESIQTLKDRFDRADQELQFAECGCVPFDLVLINEDLDTTYKSLKQFLKLP